MNLLDLNADACLFLYCFYIKKHNFFFYFYFKKFTIYLMQKKYLIEKGIFYIKDKQKVNLYCFSKYKDFISLYNIKYKKQI